MKKQKIVLGLFSVFLLVFASFSLVGAQTAGGTTGTTGTTGGTTISGCTAPVDIAALFIYATCLLQRFVVPFLVGLALVLFLAGIVKYVASGDNEEKRDAGKGLMLFGIIALFVMIGVWGLVKILYNTILPGSEFEIPNLPSQAANPFH